MVQPRVTADTSSYMPPIKATWPGRLSVGTRVCDTPHCASPAWISERKNGAGVVASPCSAARACFCSRMGAGSGSDSAKGGFGYV